MITSAMHSISSEDASGQYGIVARHSEMTENKERRFRLEKSDGTAYIRTEASGNGGWQNSHHHDFSTETYIVQSGWMAAAEMRDGRVAIYKFEAGEIYSTEPHVVHNVYLPANAVIHTIKHGPAAKGDWHGETPAAHRLNELTKKLPEDQIEARKEAYRAGPRNAPVSVSLGGGAYSDSYRHFDQLIWQVPAWSSAVFALAAASISENAVFFSQLGSSSVESSAFNWAAAFWAAMYGVVFVALAIFGVALYRFRRRQGVETVDRIEFFKSASFWSMTLVVLEAAFFLAVALITAGVANGLSVFVAVFFFVVTSIAGEARLHRSPRIGAQRHS